MVLYIRLCPLGLTRSLIDPFLWLTTESLSARESFWGDWCYPPNSPAPPPHKGGFSVVLLLQGGLVAWVLASPRWVGEDHGFLKP